MGQEAAVPPGFKEQIQKMIDQAVAKAYRSAPLRNASITDGGITVRNGYVRVRSAEGVTTAYMGGVTPALPDGTYQPGLIFRREDGSLAMALYDPDPDPDGPGDYKQFLATYDRGQNVILSDDTYSGQGLARPYLPNTFYRDRYADWVTTTSTTFETLFSAWVYKQHPRLVVQAWASNDTAGATGEVRVLVDGQPWGSVASTDFGVATKDFGAAPVAGAHMESLRVEIQARVASGGGGVRVEPTLCLGIQS